MTVFHPHQLRGARACWWLNSLGFDVSRQTRRSILSIPTAQDVRRGTTGGNVYLLAYGKTRIDEVAFDPTQPVSTWLARGTVVEPDNHTYRILGLNVGTEVRIAISLVPGSGRHFVEEPEMDDERGIDRYVAYEQTIIIGPYADFKSFSASRVNDYLADGPTFAGYIL